jgi:hypothetical protein
MIMKGREYRGYVLVKEAVLKNEDDLAGWVKLALDFNKLGKSSKKKYR